MRKLLNRLFKWILHDHDDEILYRHITYQEKPSEKKGKDWEEEKWIKLVWFKKCKTCGHRSIEIYKRK